MFRSIRGTLLGWYTVILLAVVATFASLLYHRLQILTAKRIEAELAGAAALISRRIPHPRGHPRPLLIPEDLLKRFGEEESEAAYALVWFPDGTRLASSLAPPDVPKPHAEPAPPPPGVEDDPLQPRFRQRGTLYEVVLPYRGGGFLVVGRSAAVEAAQLRHLAWLTFGLGAGLVALGLAGGRWLVGRALEPLRSMTATAQAVSASNLSERIGKVGRASELEPLAGVLDGMLDRLEAAFEQQKRFTADASHELRTPLAVIASQTELALARERSAAEYREALATCAHAAQRMRSLVDGLLTLARADAGKIQLDRSPFDVTACVEQCAALMRSLAADRGVTIGLALAPVEWNGDLHRFAQVVINLLTNAVLYNRPGGRIEVGLRLAGDLLELTVADDGIGIAPEEIGSIFKRFHRVDPARARDSGGNGLGLAISQSLVAAHGGTIDCRSELGRGSTFTVRLPPP
jgi:two-component system OmpR family sensor kinase